MPNRSPSFSVAVVLLAAGASSRMGKPKMLLPWGQNTILGHLIDVWKKVGVQQIAVVYAERDGALKAELDRLAFPQENRITNPHPDRGMFSSIRCAAQWPGWKAALTHWAIVLGDQPHISRETLQTILDFSAANPERVCLPRQGGHRRHPVVLPRQVFAQLANSKAIDLKAFLDSLPIPAAFCELSDTALELDLDTPEEYDRAAGLYSSTSNIPI